MAVIHPRKKESNRVMAKFYDKYLNQLNNNLTEKHLSDKELTKREQIAKAIARENPGMDMSKKMAIATAQAKKIAEQTSEHVHVLYANNKPLTKYTKEQDALKDADILRKKRAGTKIEIKKEIREEVEQIDEVSHELRQSWVSQTWKKHLRHVDDKPGVQKPEMPEARKKIFNVAMDKAGKESSARYEKRQQEKRLARTPVVHDLTNMSHGEVYDHTQTSSKIHDGDVLKVKGGVAAMVGAWPAMVHGTSKVLHSFNPGSDIHKIDNGSYHQTAKLADKIHGIKEDVEQIDEISKELATAFFHGKQDQARKRFARGLGTNKRGIMLAKDKIEGRAKVNATDKVDEQVEELNALLNQKGIEESYKSDDAFNLLKKKGAKNVRTTSGAIVYSHNGKEYSLRHADTSSGHRTVREDELKRHLQRLEATGNLRESFAPGKLKERLLDRYTPSVVAEDDSE